jgi:hypothetical protein
MRSINVRTALAAGTASFALVLAGCGDSDSGRTDAGAGPAATGDAPTAVTTTSPAADTLVTLDRLLGEHALLAQFATQKGLDGERDFPAIAAALDRNSVELSEVIASVYGAAAGEKFLDGTNMWRAHIGSFVDYTVGKATGDRPAQRRAVKALAAYVKDHGAFLAGATGLPADAVQGDLGEHVGQLQSQLDQYAARDYEQSYQTLGTAYEHMYMTGAALGGAVAGQKSLDAGDTTEASVALRVTLDRLLAEHAALAMFATQKGFAGDADFDAIAAELDRNSVELSEAIASVYGDEAGAKFLDGKNMWRDHITYFVEYTVALAGDDRAGQDAAVAKLGDYIRDFGGFLAEATGLPAGAVRADLTGHVGQLKAQIDAYADGRYKRAYRVEREAYAHMFMTGDTLAKAIVAQHPEMFGGDASAAAGMDMSTGMDMDH